MKMQKMMMNELVFIEEPMLAFGYKQKAAYPKDGLLLFGPFFHEKIHGAKTIGMIGPKELINKAKIFFKKLHSPILSSKDTTRDPNFPGLEPIFGISINFNNIPEVEISIETINELLKYTDAHQRVSRLVDLYVENLKKYMDKEEIPVDLWLIVIPDSIYTYGLPKSSIPKSDDNVRLSIKKQNRNSIQKHLFFQEEMDISNKAYDYEANFHNQLKAKILSSNMVTQIIRERLFKDYNNSDTEKSNDMQTETEIAWNISTTLYYKLGGLPWKLSDIREGVCYIGLVYKLIEDEKNNNACCAAQMFLDSGDGMVFKGNIGPWWNPENKEFHLKKNDAKNLIEKSIESYFEKFNDYPKELFIHAKTFFNDEEWSGFEEAADKKCKIIGIRINERAAFKMYRNGKYPIPRGFLFQYDTNKAYLWTKGFIPRIKTYPGFETPNPLDIQIDRGESDLYTVCRDILSLTKLNYNACLYADGTPVTLKFADSIGEILTAGKDIKIGVLPFKHYI
jgi:hypothetical protein